MVDRNMRRFTGTFATASGCLLAGATIATHAQSDLSVSAEYSGFDYRSIRGLTPPPPTSSGGSITPTRPKVLQMIVRNDGPADVSEAFVEMFAQDSVSAWIVAAPSPGCNFTATPPVDGARWSIGPIANGAQIECTLTLTPAPGAFPRRGVIRPTVYANGNTDPVPTNNLGTPYDVVTSPVDYVRDMALEIRSPQGILQPGIVYNVDFTLTNLGPGQEGHPNFTQSIYSERYGVGPAAGEFFALAYDGDPDCRYFVTDIGAVLISRTSEIQFGPLAPGQSRTCTLLLAVFPGAEGVRRLPFWNFAELPGVFDERLDNNIADLVLPCSPPTIPAGSPWSWALLGLALGGAGLVQARRRRGLGRGDGPH